MAAVLLWNQTQRCSPAWKTAEASEAAALLLPLIHEAKKIKHTHNIIIIYDFVANLFWLFAANSRPNSQPGSWLFGDCLVRTIISMLIVSVSLTLYLLIFDLLGY